GLYLNKVAVVKTGANDDGLNTSFYFQRLRVQAEYVAAPGVSVLTRFDALERAWGAVRSTPGTTADSISSGTRAENENIAFDYACIVYASPVGLFRVGIQPGGGFGTVFADSVGPRQRLFYNSPNLGGFTLLAIHEVFTDNSRMVNQPASVTSDRDYEDGQLAFIYAAKTWQVGMAYVYLVNATSRDAATPYKSKFNLLIPYVKANIGPVAIQAELDYWFGKMRDYEVAGVTALEKLNSLAGWVDVKVNLGPAYFGGMVAYSQGQPDQDMTRDTLNQHASGGADWNPCMIMFNYDLTYWQGGITGITNAFSNAWLYQVNGGVKIDKFDIGASITYATRDTVAPGTDKALGWEVDVTGTYKITNNLSYMLGIGYLSTGDYFKAGVATTELVNNYLVINKLTLTF
ncbi:MAG TPA: hypothetical protein PKZ12_05420, partial [Smithellaceae bacterium]|nr:hypothetical protein [Smithellaceae bacterium]